MLSVNPTCYYRHHGLHSNDSSKIKLKNKINRRYKSRKSNHVLRIRTNASSSASVNNNDNKTLQQLKDHLIHDLIPSTLRGFNKNNQNDNDNSNTIDSKIERVVQQIEEMNPTMNPVENELINGKWDCIYTTSAQVLFQTV